MYVILCFLLRLYVYFYHWSGFLIIKVPQSSIWYWCLCVCVLPVCMTTWSAKMFSSSFHQAAQKGRDKDKWQRQHGTVITAAKWVADMTRDTNSVYVPSACTHTRIVKCAICGRECLGVCVVSVCIILPIWHFRNTAARYRVWLISVAELAVEGGVLENRIQCARSHQRCFPAVLFHYTVLKKLLWSLFMLLRFSLPHWGSLFFFVFFCHWVAVVFNGGCNVALLPCYYMLLCNTRCQHFQYHQQQH